MKIAVCLKQVISPDAPLPLDERSGWIREAELPRQTNEPDLYALELALMFKDRQRAEVTAITVGPESAANTLRDALAKGADRAIHVLDADSFRREPLHIAQAIAGTLGASGYDLILTGLQSTDSGHGQTGIMIAQRLGLAHVSMVVETTLDTDGTLRARRELEAGASQWWMIALPCVLTVQSGINRPRYAGVKGIMAAKKRPLQILPYDQTPDATPPVSILCEAMAAPAARENTQMISGAIPEVAARLAEKLRAALSH